MAERSVHEAAVEAMAAALSDAEAATGVPLQVEPGDFGSVIGREADWRAIARVAIAALVASAEVREGLVAALYAKEGRWYEAEGAHRPDGTPIPGLRLWPLVDVVLAALAGTEASS